MTFACQKAISTVVATSNTDEEIIQIQESLLRTTHASLTKYAAVQHQNTV